jgi:uncharacterized protein YegP (UPF0339 family)
MYRDNRNEWRWTYFGENGEEIGVSSESYTTKQNCQHSVDMMRASKGSKIYEQSGDSLFVALDARRSLSM